MSRRRHNLSRREICDLPQAGDILDSKYRIEKLLGHGGMCAVFAATQVTLGRRVAIKVLLPEWVDDPAIAARFAREGRATAAIQSEHVVRVLDVDEWDGRPYLVLEYLQGVDFEQLLDEHGKLTVESAVDLVLQACEAIAEAHAAGTVHRDLKPANLFLTRRADRSACVKVLDFGVSKMAMASASAARTEPGIVLGSPHYMAPEQMQSAKDADERADIWSLGAILHELLTGHRPFDGDSLTEICAQVLSAPPPPMRRSSPDLPPTLEAAVLRCLEKDRARRFSGVAELARAIAQFGSASAQESAARISRVLEGGIEHAHGDASLAMLPISFAVPNRARATKRPWTGYALAAIAVVGGIVWMTRDPSAIRSAEQALHPTEVSARAPTSFPIASPTGRVSLSSASTPSTRARDATAEPEPLASAKSASPATDAPAATPRRAHRRERRNAQADDTSDPIHDVPSSVRRGSAASDDPDSLFEDRK